MRPTAPWIGGDPPKDPPEPRSASTPCYGSPRMSSRVVQATLRIVTPLFLGGAEPTKTCELRAASVKGALLFWWRALRPGVPLADLRRMEEELFGSSRTGQAKWLFDARGEALLPGRGKLELDQGRGYLAGQGLARLTKDPQNQLGRPQRRFSGAAPQPKPLESTRPYLRPGGRILLRAFRRDGSTGAAAEAAAIRDALVALATFGGLGSRSRRGFGSLHLQQLAWTGEEGHEEVVEPTGPEGWQTRVADLLGGLSPATLPAFTCFSDQARVLVLEAPDTSAEDLHEELGRRFKDFRSHQRSGGVGEADHDDLVAWLKNGALAAPPRRAVFGLPHNYYFSSTGTKIGVNPAGKSNRRASPLFIHVDEIGDPGSRRAVAVVTFLPAAFLPANERIEVKEVRGRSTRLDPRAAPGLWQPVHDWLDELKGSPPRGATVWEKP